MKQACRTHRKWGRRHRQRVTHDLAHATRDDAGSRNERAKVRPAMQAMTSHRTRDMASTEVDRDACAGDQRLRSERRGEEVYRVSVDVLRACQGVVVETFDERALPDVDGSGRARAWSRAAARALVTLLERFRPQRILVHNYHNLLSSAILPVLARYKRHSGCGLFMTAHDYHLLFYNPSLLIYPGGRAQPLPIDQLHRGRRIALAASARCSSRCREEAALACGQRAFRSAWPVRRDSLSESVHARPHCAVWPNARDTGAESDRLDVDSPSAQTRPGRSPRSGVRRSRGRGQGSVGFSRS